MKSAQSHPIFALAILTVIVVAGCSQPQSETAGNVTTPVKSPGTSPAPEKVPLKRVSDRPGNPDGAVFIAEYHHIRTGKTTMERPVEAFRADLERLKSGGAR